MSAVGDNIRYIDNINYWIDLKSDIPDDGRSSIGYVNFYEYQTKKISIDQQIKDIMKYAKKRGKNLRRIYVEAEPYKLNIDDRVGLTEMLLELKSEEEVIISHMACLCDGVFTVFKPTWLRIREVNGRLICLDNFISNVEETDDIRFDTFYEPFARSLDLLFAHDEFGGSFEDKIMADIRSGKTKEEIIKGNQFPRIPWLPSSPSSDKPIPTSPYLSALVEAAEEVESFKLSETSEETLPTKPEQDYIVGLYLKGAERGEHGWLNLKTKRWNSKPTTGIRNEKYRLFGTSRSFLEKIVDVLDERETDRIKGIDAPETLCQSIKAKCWNRQKDDSEKVSCFCCGISLLPEGPWEVCHIRPKSHGGQNNLENLAIGCVKCNRGKGGMHSIHAYEYMLTKKMKGLEKITCADKRMESARLLKDVVEFVKSRSPDLPEEIVKDLEPNKSVRVRMLAIARYIEMGL
jgi:hypothetical protein